MNKQLIDAQKHLGSLSKKDKGVPSNYAFFRYVLVSKVGLSLEEFNSSPSPLLWSLYDCYVYEKEQEAKAVKRNR